MPEPRKTRSASVKPAAKEVAKPPVKPAPRSRTAATKRRAEASPDRSPSPPPKRSRATSKKPEDKPAPAPKKRGKTPTVTPATNGTNGRAVKKTSSKLNAIAENGHAPVIYFNPLPRAPAPSRPPLHLFVWGAGNFGQFGTGPDDLGEKDKPKKSTWVESMILEGAFGSKEGDSGAGIDSVAAGGLHTLFIDEKGIVWSCGVNDDAALGRVTTDVPDPENPEKNMDIDELTSWPHPLEVLKEEKFRAVQITAGDSISAAISDNGELRVWGSFRANEGSLGFSSALKHQVTPIQILNLPQPEKAVSVVCGANHILVLTTHGHIYTWGAGEQAQLGRRIIERRKIHGTNPEKITLGNRSRKAVLIGAGAYHSFAVDEAGDVWAWGLNSMGQTGTGRANEAEGEVQIPTKVPGLSKEELKGATVVGMVGGEHHSLFLTSAGHVYACGRANGGQLGLEEDDDAFEGRENKDFLDEPTRITTFPDDDEDPIVHISAGSHNNMAISRDGALYAWGQGLQGELGAGDVDEIRTPKVIVRRSGGAWKAVKVSCGGQHTLGLFQKRTT